MVVKSDNFFQQCMAVCACGAMAKDSTIRIYVRLESCYLIKIQHLHLKSVADISLLATIWRFLGLFQELSGSSVKSCLHFRADEID